MNFLYLLAPALCASGKATVQGALTKKRVTSFSDAAALNATVFLLTAVIFSALFVRAVPSVEVFGYALLSAIFVVGFQFSYTLAFKNGSVASAAIINTFNVIFPLVTGALLYSEKWSMFTVIGCVFMAAAFYLVPSRTGNAKSNGKWLLFTLLAFVFAGLNNTLALVFSRSDFAVQSSYMVALSYAFAFPIALITFAFSRKREKRTGQTSTFSLGVATIFPTLAISVLLGVNNLLTLKALATWRSNVFFPVTNGATIVFTAVLNVVCFREKPSLGSVIGIALAVIAAVLLNLG